MDLKGKSHSDLNWDFGRCPHSGWLDGPRSPIDQCHLFLGGSLAFMQHPLAFSRIHQNLHDVVTPASALSFCFFVNPFEQVVGEIDADAFPLSQLD